MKDESRKLFLKYGEKYQKAIKEENYIEAFVAILAGIREADEKNDREVIKAMIGLVKTLNLLISSKYGVLHRNHLGAYAHKCFLCANNYKKEELFSGSEGAICKNCAILAHKTFSLSP